MVDVRIKREEIIYGKHLPQQQKLSSQDFTWCHYYYYQKCYYFLLLLVCLILVPKVEHSTPNQMLWILEKLSILQINISCHISFMFCLQQLINYLIMISFSDADRAGTNYLSFPRLTQHQVIGLLSYFQCVVVRVLEKFQASDHLGQITALFLPCSPNTFSS